MPGEQGQRKLAGSGAHGRDYFTDCFPVRDLVRANNERDKPPLENFRRTMSKEELNEEFNSEFTAQPGQFISPELFRSAIRSDIKPPFPEDEA